MLIGGLWVDNSHIEFMKSRIMDIRKTFSWSHEYKWKRLAKANIEQYKLLVDVFFESEAAFHCIVIDNNRLDHKHWNDGDSELGFYKFYYTLLSNKLRPGNDYYILPMTDLTEKTVDSAI